MPGGWVVAVALATRGCAHAPAAHGSLQELALARPLGRGGQPRQRSRQYSTGSWVADAGRDDDGAGAGAEEEEEEEEDAGGDGDEGGDDDDDGPVRGVGRRLRAGGGFASTSSATSELDTSAASARRLRPTAPTAGLLDRSRLASTAERSTAMALRGAFVSAERGVCDSGVSVSLTRRRRPPRSARSLPGRGR
jgi:hypothetical protein